MFELGFGPDINITQGREGKQTQQHKSRGGFEVCSKAPCKMTCGCSMVQVCHVHRVGPAGSPGVFGTSFCF